MRQLVYTLFLSNNCSSFHLWLKENLGKTSNSLKILWNDCSSFSLFTWTIKSFLRSNVVLLKSLFINIFCFFSLLAFWNIFVLSLNRNNSTTIVRGLWHYVSLDVHAQFQYHPMPVSVETNSLPLSLCGWFKLVTPGFELGTRKVELVTREFKLVDLNS